MSCIALVVGIDSIILWKDISIHPTTRWFFLHAIVNFAIACIALNGVLQFFKDPLASMMPTDDDDEGVFAANSKWSLTLVVCLHLYHCSGQFKLTYHDIFHHLTFLPTLAIPGMVFDWGCFSNYLVFFVCGVPGGVDYFMLGLQKIGRLLDWNQKRICANLNMWMRLPGILFAIGVAYVILLEQKYTVPRIALLFQLIFMPFNVIFYGKQSVINYTLFQVKDIVPTQDWTVLKKKLQ